MKIGILTFHNALNYGAALQAYALSFFLHNKGHDVEIINYINAKMLKELDVWDQVRSIHNPIDKAYALFRVPIRKKQRVVFDSFLKSKVKLSGPIISSSAQLESISERYQAILVGSDQVFNINGTGGDLNFFLKFYHGNGKKVAYAPSFGLLKVEDNLAKEIGSLLISFDALSVRDASSVSVVRSLTGLEPQIVLDPTLLIDETEWHRFAIHPKISKRYILVYSFGSTHLEALAEAKAREIDGVVLNVNRLFPALSDRVLRVISPSVQEFVGLFSGAEYVVTNSYHGLMFSLIFKKQFSLFINEYQGAEGTNTRFFSLGQKLGISSSIRQIKDGLPDSFLEYESVHNIIKTWRKESGDYLINALYGTKH